MALEAAAKGGKKKYILRGKALISFRGVREEGSVAGRRREGSSRGEGGLILAAKGESQSIPPGGKKKGPFGLLVERSM